MANGNPRAFELFLEVAVLAFGGVERALGDGPVRKQLPLTFQLTALGMDQGFEPSDVGACRGQSQFVGLPIDFEKQLAALDALTGIHVDGGDPAVHLSDQRGRGPRADLADGAFHHLHGFHFGIDRADHRAPVWSVRPGLVTALGTVAVTPARCQQQER